MAFFPFEATPFGGVAGGRSSSSNPSMSTSGSFFFGSSAALGSRFTVGVALISVFRIAGDFMAPSSNSSYSSNRSRRLLESWNPDVFPPYPPPSP